MLHRYADRRCISIREAKAEPWEEIERAFYLWSLDNDRDKLETERRKAAR